MTFPWHLINFHHFSGLVITLWKYFHVYRFFIYFISKTCFEFKTFQYFLRVCRHLEKRPVCGCDLTFGKWDTVCGRLKLRLWDIGILVGRNPALWWALLGMQVLASAVGDSYCWLEEGHFPFKIVWQILSIRLMITLSCRQQKHRQYMKWVKLRLVVCCGLKPISRKDVL